MIVFLAVLAANTLSSVPESKYVPEAPGFDLTATAFPALRPDDAPPPDLGVWKGSVSAGGTIADGNTRRKTGTATATAVKRWEKERLTFDFLWNYAQELVTTPAGNQVMQTTQRRTFGDAKYDRFLSKRAYLLAQASGEGDLNAQLNLRTTAGVGAGYQFVENERWKVSGELGVAYVTEDYKDNTADKDFPAGRGAYKVDWKPSEAWAIGQTGEIYPSLENSEDVSSRLDTHAKLMLSKSIFAQFQWLFTWDNTPATGAKRTDDLYLLTVGWSF
jgi:putative salt-induced outer membrane protein YdiY